MPGFLNKDFLLDTKTARRLYHNYAKKLPIIDYHCHVSPKEIYEDRQFKNITELWLEGDHYKWRLMRANGTDERYITGDASDFEKFYEFAKLMPKAVGNPMYHWCHMELKTYFGYTGALRADTAKEVWDICEKKLAAGSLSVRGIIKKSNVEFIGTTDDPVDSLYYHKLLLEDKSMETIVAPTFRPDKAQSIEKDGWREYIMQLSDVSGEKIEDINSLKDALKIRMEHFARHGCRASDHGLDRMVFKEADKETLDQIFKKGLSGQKVEEQEAEAFKTELLTFCAGEYVRLGWVMQLHYNCMRNPNSLAFEKLGHDTGFDCIGPHDGSRALAGLLDKLYRQNSLPRTVIYSLDAADNAFIDSLIGAFQESEIPGKLQHGSAWWFNDHKKGIQDHLISLANLGLLGNFIGMLTDSRSFLSYTRHEYFRRILCGLLGRWAENGEFPEDAEVLAKLVSDICYANAKRYFGLEGKA